MARALKNHHGEIAHAFTFCFRNPLQVLCGGGSDVDRAHSVWPNSNLFHVETWARIKHGAALRNCNHRNGVSFSRCSERSSVNRVYGNVGVWLAAIAHHFAVEQHGGFVFFALTNDHNAAHGHGAKHHTHGVYGCAIGSDFVSTAHPARRCHGSRFGGADKFKGKVAVWALCRHISTVVRWVACHRVPNSR